MRIDAFLEGPRFDRAGNLWLVDLAHGRLLRMSASGKWDVALEYDGQPSGLAIHKDGGVWLAWRHGRRERSAMAAAPFIL